MMNLILLFENVVLVVHGLKQKYDYTASDALVYNKKIRLCYHMCTTKLLFYHINYGYYF